MEDIYSRHWLESAQTVTKTSEIQKRLSNNELLPLTSQLGKSAPNERLIVSFEMFVTDWIRLHSCSNKIFSP